MIDWNEYGKQVNSRLGEFSKLTPDTMKGLVTMDRAGEKANHLGQKVRELIALAVAVTTRCDACLSAHARAAVAHGATKEEIAEALGVAVGLNAGAAVVYSARALDSIATMTKE
nr:carboxymuconolactone decarboxylase family protein [Aminobacter lissarensis]